MVSYAYPEVTICKLSDGLRLESEKILEQLEHSNKDEEPNNKPSSKFLINFFITTHHK